jgi:hypothetical protein
MDLSAQIENVKSDNLKKKFRNELHYIKNGGNMNMIVNHNEQDMNERITLLEALLNMPLQKKPDSVQQQKESLFREDKFIYKKQWNRLLPFHKIIKLKEYLNENIQNEILRNELIEKISKCTQDGKMNTKKSVIYDPNTEKILSIPCLIIDHEKNTYQLKII